jgi:hypothetical protein
MAFRGIVLLKHGMTWLGWHILTEKIQVPNVVATLATPVITWQQSDKITCLQAEVHAGISSGRQGWECWGLDVKSGHYHGGMIVSLTGWYGWC